MKKAAETPAIIWDLDGTLLDSYEMIISSLQEAYGEHGIVLDRNAVYREVMLSSVYAWIRKTEEWSGMPFDTVKKRYLEITDLGAMRIPPMQHAPEILQFLQDRGIPSFVFTHRGSTAVPVLKNTGLFGYFNEIIDGSSSFPRKPDPSAIFYLIQRHSLSPEKTFYVGDRTVDIECASHAGIGSILYLPECSPVLPSGKETYIVRDLLDIRNIAGREN